MENTIEEQTSASAVPPSKEDVIKWMVEQIEFKTIQVQVQELDTRIAVSKAEYMKAMYTIAQISAPQNQNNGLKEHILTEEDIAANPELVEQGFKAGDTVGVPEMEEAVENTMERKLKK